MQKFFQRYYPMKHIKTTPMNYVKIQWKEFANANSILISKRKNNSDTKRYAIQIKKFIALHLFISPTFFLSDCAKKFHFSIGCHTSRWVNFFYIMTNNVDILCVVSCHKKASWKWMTIVLSKECSDLSLSTPLMSINRNEEGKVLMSFLLMFSSVHYFS